MAELPYMNAKAGQARESEIRNILRGAGATAIGFMVDDDKDLILAQFRLGGREMTVPIRVGAYAEAWLRANPYTNRTRASLSEHTRRAREQAELAAWAILADYIKAQTAMIAAGFTDVDTAFLPHVHLPDGRRFMDAAAASNSPLRLPPPKES